MLLMWRHQEPLRRYTGGFSFHRYADKKRNNMPVELSPEEDELREMVKGTLETNGILNDLRVRTSVSKDKQTELYVFNSSGSIAHCCFPRH